MRLPNRLQTTLWLCRALVWSAAWLAPRRKRSAWRSDRNRELFHWCLFLSESGQLTPENRFQIARRCWGLFPEAFWLRFPRERLFGASNRLLGSPWTLLLTLAAAVAALIATSGVVPAFRTAIAPPVPHAEQTVIISLAGSGINGKYSRTRSDTLLDVTAVWTASKHANGITPFSWSPANLLLQSRDLPVATARVGADFFTTLDVHAALGRVFASSDVERCPQCVLLSYAVWQHEFDAEPSIVGRSIDLNGTARTVIGVLPANFRLISPGIAVWGLIDPATLFTNFQRRVGAIARLKPGASAEALQRELTDLTESAGYVHPASQLQVVTVAALARRNRLNLAWFLLLATAAAVVIAVLRRSANGLGPQPETSSGRFLWLAFLTAKSLLALAIAALLAWSVVHLAATWAAGSTYPMADEYSLWLYLPLAIVVVAGSVRDQQRRCRVCLRRLDLPVEIGRTGSVLLNWAGTEMVCPAGHGVLYLPESSANSLDQYRWSTLDDSWKGLFHAD
jgi:hypothetical protein